MHVEMMNSSLRQRIDHASRMLLRHQMKLNRSVSTSTAGSMGSRNYFRISSSQSSALKWSTSPISYYQETNYFNMPSMRTLSTTTTTTSDNHADNDTNANKSFQEWTRTLQSYIENEELSKIKETVGYMYKNEQFQKKNRNGNGTEDPYFNFNAEIMGEILDVFVKAQGGLLDQLVVNSYFKEEGHARFNDCDTKNADDKRDIEIDTDTDTDASKILNEAWKITSDADDLLRDFGMRNNANANANANTNISANNKNHLNAKHFQTIIQAWGNLMNVCTSNDNVNINVNANINVKLKGVPQRATYQLEVMERLAMKQSASGGGAVQVDIAPTIDTYNSILETWSQCPENALSSTLRAESILRRMEGARSASENKNANANAGVVPNAETYRIMMRAWRRVANDVALSKRKIGNAAFNATGYLMSMQNQSMGGYGHSYGPDDDDFEPTLEDYKVVFEAWGEGRYAKYAGKRALSLLKKMERDSSNSDSESVKPDAQCYKNVLFAMSESKAQYSKGLGYHAEDILKRMEDNALVPDTECYMYAIQIWSNSACRNEATQNEIYEDAERANDVLDRMKIAHHRSGLVMVKPTAIDYNNVMRAWSRGSSHRAMTKVEELLSKLEQSYAKGEGEPSMAPTYESYLRKIEVLENSRNTSNQIDEVVDALARMKEQHDNGNEACSPNIACYNTVIAVCGNRSFKLADDQEKQKALKCAIEILQTLRSNNKQDLRPTTRTYVFTLEAFSILMDRKSPEFRKGIESVFQMCCNDGLIDDKVIKTFRRVAPFEVYRQCILSKSFPKVDTDKDGNITGNAYSTDNASKTLFLPELWTRNIDGGIRQRIPLAVDGRFVHERSPVVSEYKMRRLRRKPNQALLLGGRM